MLYFAADSPKIRAGASVIMLNRPRLGGRATSYSPLRLRCIFCVADRPGCWLLMPNLRGTYRLIRALSALDSWTVSASPGNGVKFTERWDVGLLPVNSAKDDVPRTADLFVFSFFPSSNTTASFRFLFFALRFCASFFSAGAAA